MGPVPSVRRSAQVSSSRASAATCAAGVPAVSLGVHHSKPPAERNRDRCCTQPGAHWLSPIPPGLCREDAEFELVGGESQFVSPSKHDLEVAHIGGDGPPELVERQTGVLAEPARYEPVEDKDWLATGRGTEVQELGGERRSEVRQPGDTVVAQARIPIDRPPFNSCAGGGLKSASAFGTASSTRRTRNGPYPTRPYPQRLVRAHLRRPGPGRDRPARRASHRGHHRGQDQRARHSEPGLRARAVRVRAAGDHPGDRVRPHGPQPDQAHRRTRSGPGAGGLDTRPDRSDLGHPFHRPRPGHIHPGCTAPCPCIEQPSRSGAAAAPARRHWPARKYGGKLAL